MKKHLMLLMLFAMLIVGAVSAFAGGAAWMDNTSLLLTQATDNQVTAAVTLPSTSTFLGGPVTRVWLKVPVLTSSTVYVQCMGFGDNTYYDFYAFSNSTNQILGTSAASTGSFILEVPGNVSMCQSLKVKCGTAQAANRQFTIWGR